MPKPRIKLGKLRDAAYESARKRNRLTRELRSDIEYFVHANKHVDSIDDANRPLEVSSAVDSGAKHSVAPSTTPAPVVTLKQQVSIKVPYGMVALNPGERLGLVSRTGTTARVEYNGAEYNIPVSSTDLAK
jgi:hypothetical protein